MTDDPSARPPLPGGALDPQDLWILEHQILPNVYGLKYAALSRVLDALRAAPPAIPSQEEQTCPDCLRTQRIGVRRVENTFWCEVCRRWMPCNDEPPAIPEAGGETLDERLERAAVAWWSNAIAGACSASVKGMAQTGALLREAKADLARLRAELARVTEESRMGHVWLDECADGKDTAGKTLYDRISAKIQKLSELAEERRHIIEAVGAEKDELRAKANAAEHRCRAAEYRAQRIVLDAELKQCAEAADARAETLQRERDEQRQALAALRAKWKSQVRAGTNDEKVILDCAADLDALAAGDREPKP